ncbi:MAG: type IV pili methyl-accepting chemotaxis transducer N-terminal domain-containing protein [Myxococcales bacterium]|nr:type IV pili methyl-accepting chemotaxis transducer N-terminal domain-containing protein [Myxococcales bacterium]
MSQLMTIRLLLYVQVVVFVLLLAVALIATLELARADGGDGLYINIAGRQRMLSQKLMFEALALAKDPSEERKDALEFTMALFATSHRSLHIGGQTPLELNGDNPVFVRGASDSSLIGLLGQVEAYWKPMRKGLSLLIEASQRREEALQVLLDKNPKLFQHIDSSVRCFLADKASGSVVNVAGRQRLLSQRTALQAVLIDTVPSDSLRAELQENMELFEVSLHGLREGGEVTVGQSRHPITIPGTNDRDVLDELDEVEALWSVQREAISTLTDPNSQFQRALQQVEENGPRLLFTMNEAVLRAQRVAEQNLNTLKQIQVSAVMVGLIVAILSGALVNTLGRSLKKLLSMTNAISRGELSEPVEPSGIGELRALSRSFERMRFSLKATMELLEAEGVKDKG